MDKREKVWSFIRGDLQLVPGLFEHLPNAGFKFVGGRRSIVIQDMAVTKSGVWITDFELEQLATASQLYLDAVEERGIREYVPECIFRRTDFPRYQGDYGFKFMSQETYDQYISKGSFLLSSLQRFRDMEQQGDPAGDRFEGASRCSYQVADRQLTVGSLSGFDSNILSLACDLRNAAEMKRKFGPVVLRVAIEPFAREIARGLGTRSPDIRAVRYADLKMYRDKLSLGDVAGFPLVGARLARVLRDSARLPSIFAKPRRFSDEREVRIAFAHTADVPYKTIVENKRLLAYLTPLDI